MINVFLHGKLAEEFGEKWTIGAKSVAGACRIIEANHPGKFLKALVGNKYHILRDEIEEGNDIGEDLLTFEQSKDIHIMPVIQGSKKTGVFQVVMGVIMIAAAVYTGGAAAGVWGGVGVSGGGVGSGAALGSLGAGMAGTTFMGVSMAGYAMFGAAMVFGGISAMLTSPGEIGTGGAREATDPRKSFIFTGAENVSAQGINVPVIYGEIETGSVQVSSALYVEKI